MPNKKPLFFGSTRVSKQYVSFHLIDSSWGVSSLCAQYINHKGTRSYTFMELDGNGKIRRHMNHFME